MGAAKILTVTKNGETLKSLSLEGEAILGRAEGCVIRLEDRAISRQHAVFRSTSEGVQVEKKSEFAPLKVNGLECTRALVKEGDVISIGPYLVKVSDSAPAPTSAPSLELAPSEGDATRVISNAAEIQDAEVEAQPLEAFPMDSMAQSAPASDNSFKLEDPDFALPHAERPSGPIEVEVSTPSLGLAEDAIQEDAATRIVSLKKIIPQLSFSEGAANHVHFDVTQDEVAIGRGKECEVVLNDKKASRKNSVIRRDGMKFIIKDEGSANGTFVNGSRVQEQELTSGDQIKIGTTSFGFKIFERDYEEKAKGFLPVPQDDVDLQDDPLMGSQLSSENVMPSLHHFDPNPAQNISSVSIAGISQPGSSKSGKKSILEWFREQPKKRQAIIAVIVIGGLYLFMDDSSDKKPIDKKPPAIAKKSNDPNSNGLPTFEQLSADQQRFVKTQHQLAFEYYKNKDYDKALYEIDKVLAIVSDYEQAREIERYSKDGKRKMEAIEEEKRKREEESKVKIEVAELVEKTRALMENQKYEQAKIFFSDILALDPDNAQIAEWRKKIDAFEEQRALEAQQKRVQQEINRRGWETYKEAERLRSQGQYYPAIADYQKVFDINSNDKHLSAVAKEGIQSSKDSIKSLREPVLTDAKQAEQSGDLPKAYQLFKKATLIDPPHPDGYEGMKRIEGVLHERAKAVYVEAVLAESYSDFAMAKQKFQECLDMAPSDDIYHERAERKLKRYFYPPSDAASK